MMVESSSPGGWSGNHLDNRHVDIVKVAAGILWIFIVVVVCFPLN